MREVLEHFSQIVSQSDVTIRIIEAKQQVIRADILLKNQTRLIAAEYTYFDTERFKYSYQWMTHDNQLIRRWDNAHPVDLPTSPHHQHVGSEENVITSEPMTLDVVLTFIVSQLISS